MRNVVVRKAYFTHERIAAPAVLPLRVDFIEGLIYAPADAVWVGLFSRLTVDVNRYSIFFPTH
jgi:hypothetical protein